ncbi:class II aldolase/adducin domain protein [Burkholderia lata]|uniref:Class II aldolase/adducin domain protein n=1 Tax=Burkholderia lata (strain ATCC 17760 / DSM 23089 / LMG 22485 / NCIMB 9086 / R18194 / 383) TaxID=482957 RepID=A0A6P2UMQ7_BURL3|nr:aldolase [Burkholderia lata]VWC76241.1 class II aldolase/adducin domain protein [Burkholderia lata]
MSDTFGLTKADLIKKSQAEMDRHLSGSDYTLEQKLALTCRILFENGHDSGLAGQITARAPEQNTYLTQQLGYGFDEITAENLLQIDEDLNVLRGQGMANPANRFHSWVYRARPDVQCIIHTHAMHTAALSMLEVPLEVSHMDNCVLYDNVAFASTWPGVPVGNEEGEFITAALGDKRALFLAHHGLLVTGTSVEEACVLSMAFERAAKMQLIAMAAGQIQPIDRELGIEAREWVTRPRRTAATFAYYARRALKHHADCL